MLRESRMKRKKMALAITRPVSFSCVYFTCIKKRTTRIALKVAMLRARIVFRVDTMAMALMVAALTPAMAR